MSEVDRERLVEGMSELETDQSIEDMARMLCN
jgi:hypothetical protein